MSAISFIHQAKGSSKNAEEGLYTGADAPKPPSLLPLSSGGSSSANVLVPRVVFPLHWLTCISWFDTCMPCS